MAAHEEYLNSKEHKAWLEEWDKRDEDHNELRNDPDPKGWNLYLKVIKDPAGSFLDFTHEVCVANPESAEVQTKALDKFILAKKTDFAITAAINIGKHHGKYHKSPRAISRFEAYLKEADTSKLSAKSSELLKVFNEELLPAFKK